MVFRSRIDHWLLLVLAAAAAFPLMQALAGLGNGVSWFPHLIIFALLAGLFSWLLLSTLYTVHEDMLVVQSGPFRWRIARSGITQISPSTSMLSGPALSLDRLRIEYAGGRKSILVSPRDKAAFLEALAVRSNAA